MKTQVGMWIDHREANIVFLSSAGEKTRQIKSNVEKQLRRSGDSSSNGSYETQMVPASDQRERGYMGHLANYYEEVFLAAHADKMTPRQVSEKVRNFYRTTPAILLRNGDCH